MEPEEQLPPSPSSESAAGTDPITGAERTQILPLSPQPGGKSRPGRSPRRRSKASARPRRKPSEEREREPDPIDAYQLGREPGDRITGEEKQLEAREVGRSLYWLYRGFCKVVGAPVEARPNEFNAAGAAWVALARRIPGIRLFLLALGPLVTAGEVLNHLANAWEARKRFRDLARFRRRQEETGQDGAEAA